MYFIISTIFSLAMQIATSTIVRGLVDGSAGFCWGALILFSLALFYGLVISLINLVSCLAILIARGRNNTNSLFFSVQIYSESASAFLLKCTIVELLPGKNFFGPRAQYFITDPQGSEAFIFGQVVSLVIFSGWASAFSDKIMARLQDPYGPALMIGILRKHGVIATPPHIMARHPSHTLQFVDFTDDGGVDESDPIFLQVKLLTFWVHESILEACNLLDTFTMMAISTRWPVQAIDFFSRPRDWPPAKDTSTLGRFSIPCLAMVVGVISTFPGDNLVYACAHEAAMIYLWQMTNFPFIGGQDNQRLQRIFARMFGRVPGFRAWRLQG